MKEFFRNLTASLTTNKDGFSARKLSAFVVMACVIAAHIAWLKHSFLHDDFSQLQPVLIIDYGFVAACLGFVLYEKVKEKQNPGV